MADLLYRIERKGAALNVRLEERGSRKILYLDTLRAIAKESDKEALELLVKIQLQKTRNLETLSFQQIEVPSQFQSDVLKFIAKTGRMIDETKKAVPICKPLEVFPRLILKDSSGSFANLLMDYGTELLAFEDFAPTVKGRPRLKKEEQQFEKDLLEAGFMRKTVGDSHYYCPSEKVKEALNLLLDVGWKVQDMRGLPLVKLQIREEKGMIAIRSCIRGMIDPKIQMEGVWEGETLYVKKNRISSTLALLGSADWEANLLKLAEGLQNGASIETAPPSSLFQGKLLPYQQKGVDWLQFLYTWGFSGLLADEMGLGKTVQVLAFLSRLGTNLPILIVAPTSLLFNWRAEIDRFLPGREQISLISYAALRINEEEMAKQEFEVIVLDESNAIKTAATQTARAACKLKGRFKIALSGTPMENRLDELGSQFHFLLPNLIEKSSDLETVKRRITPFILRRRKEDVELQLPEKIEQIVWIEMDEEQKNLYNQVRKEGHGTSRMQILEAILRLRQICCDPRLIGGSLPGAKMEQLIADVKDALEEKRKILIFSQFTSLLKLIQKEFSEAIVLDGSTSVEKRGELVRKFQEEPEYPLFLLSLKAGGVGLNLTAADYVLLFDPWWNEAVERQAIDRAYRIGQKKSILAKRYLMAGSIEEKMLLLKRKKLEMADRLFDLEQYTEEDLLYLLS